MEKSKVYFTDFRTRLGEGLPSKLKRLMKAAGIQDMDMDHKFVAIKMHFGELGNLGFLRPNYAKAVADVEPAATAGVDGSAVCTVKAVKAGDATITVTAKGSGQPEATAQCKVQVTAPKVPVTDVQITTPVGKNIVEAGGALQLTAIVYPENATNKALTWSSDSSGVATVDKDGRVAGVAPGKATIQVTTVDGGKQDQFDVECSGISLSASNLKLFVNESKSLSFPLYGAASGKQVEWSSSNISVADVSGGRITGRNPGTATITATVYGTGYSASCSVTVEEDLAGAIQTEVEAGQVCGFSQSEILSELDDWCDEKTGGRLEYVTGLRVATGQGVLYYGYVSPDAHGHGVGGTERYYRRALTQQAPPRTEQPSGDFICSPL